MEKNGRSGAKVQVVQEHQETAGDAGDALPIKGMKLTPYGWPAMGGAYLGLVQFLIGKPEARDAFKEHTKMDVTRALGFGVSPLERMVDKSCGYDQAVVAAFADWVTEFHWGDDADPEVRAGIEADDSPEHVAEQ